MKRRNIRRSQVIMFAETATNHRRVGLKFNTIVTGPDMNVMLSSKEIYQGRVQTTFQKSGVFTSFIIQGTFPMRITC